MCMYVMYVLLLGSRFVLYKYVYCYLGVDMYCTNMCIVTWEQICIVQIGSKCQTKWGQEAILETYFSSGYVIEMFQQNLWQKCIFSLSRTNCLPYWTSLTLMHRYVCPLIPRSVILPPALSFSWEFVKMIQSNSFSFTVPEGNFATLSLLYLQNAYFSCLS